LGSEREEIVGRGGIGLRYCTVAAVTSNAICWQIGGFYPFAKKTSKEKLYDQENERSGSTETEGQYATLEHKLSADTFLNGNFDTKAMVVFRKLVPSFSAHISINLAALPQTPSLCFNILACTRFRGHKPIPIPNRRYAINSIQIVSFTG
jgi:hypothetical protein